MIETRKCSEKLSDVINMIDGVITKIPNGPVKDINQILESYLPIIGCEKEEFEIIVRKSRNFKYLYHEVPYVVAEFQYGSVVVGLPFWIEEKKISDGYAKVKK